MSTKTRAPRPKPTEANISAAASVLEEALAAVKAASNVAKRSATALNKLSTTKGKAAADMAESLTRMVQKVQDLHAYTGGKANPKPRAPSGPRPYQGRLTRNIMEKVPGGTVTKATLMRNAAHMFKLPEESFFGGGKYMY